MTGGDRRLQVIGARCVRERIGALQRFQPDLNQDAIPLRPVLVELGATVPARGLYVTEPELTDLDTAVTGWAATAGPLIRGVLVGYEASEA